MNNSIWHTELDDLEKYQVFSCLFFKKSEPKTLCLGFYNPILKEFGDYMSHEGYSPCKIEKFAKIEDLVHIESELEKTKKQLAEFQNAVLSLVKDNVQTIQPQQYLGDMKIKKLQHVEPLEFDKLKAENEIDPECLYIVERS